ncbi:MAG: hypothetical protein ACD_51C00281G0012 [uncultured bacterium]|nr:MAG: hypothetical protein ACD_51C00281G0012 [uncultured bacterium]OGJ47945.1 MAG: hypothetical protein A2344_04160 [Candidatus Peregrinibacteria bacterium RIFOXYB12_FULL_41_12]OGJ48511.1 MAG: hypothetical protein A2244_05820 [Candidatus Peregrinibacteria bacterium RIFOXYA2_FULL_41_18]OGJ51785.1 MAG: hypothetical protein A2336_00845 [Candidatus Peregrinibacteria bacterium RIFOXYB2_FULL_41_88]OGJ53475.1 MAG: hypothetical protein A2448_02780 [Candidatus Peregrinibacteria bacterium RIFOXYC2_FULL
MGEFREYQEETSQPIRKALGTVIFGAMEIAMGRNQTIRKLSEKIKKRIGKILGALTPDIISDDCLKSL